MNIEIKNASQNNLKNIDLNIPHNQFIVVTGVSGSGKSSLAFETLYEEGRRRYVESMSSYIRQFIGKIQKPRVDSINNLPPSIAIEQKKSTSNSRSTVGTVTELYHYLQLLFARAGKIYSPISGKEVKRHTVDDVTEFVLQQKSANQINIFFEKQISASNSLKEQLELLVQKGFIRIKINHELVKISDFLNKPTAELEKTEITDTLWVLVDRIIPDPDDTELEHRIADSVSIAYYEGHGRCKIELDDGRIYEFSNQLEMDGIQFEEPAPEMFSFNSPYGACPECGGFGEILGIDENKVIANPYKSVYDGAVLCWESSSMKKWKDDFILKAARYQFPIHTPYIELSEEQKDLLWNGAPGLEGIYDFFEFIESQSYKVHYRIFLSRFRGRTQCRSCKGARLRKEALYVKFHDRHIGQLLLMPIDQLHAFFHNLPAELKENKIVKRILPEITGRLDMLVKLGLGYLHLNRTTRSLSGGELQRVQLVYCLGSNLTGALYILDEPSIGLHPRDTSELVKILKQLRDLGNTVIVVEHDEEIIRAADFLIDLGPGAGHLGGQIIYQGKINKINGFEGSLTIDYLTGKRKVTAKHEARTFTHFIELKGATRHNLKHIDVQFPVNAMTVVTGVSGSGKSTLVTETLYESLKPINQKSPPYPFQADEIKLDKRLIHGVELIDQFAIEGNRRSNPATYMKVFDAIRELMASLPLSRQMGYTPAYFSFNVEGGRCENCKGDGNILVEMQFVADLYLVCEECNGKRYKKDILEIEYKGKNIYDILQMTVEEAFEFFQDKPSIIQGLEPLKQVGLDYIQLGQPTSTLSGGEIQRLKLATFLHLGYYSEHPMLFIFDEPTTGLHFHDINKLLHAFDALINKGHTLVIIEHNPEIIKNADYIIDLGPEGGDKGGHVLYQGPREGLLSCKNSYTAQFLQSKLVIE